MMTRRAFGAFSGAWIFICKLIGKEKPSPAEPVQANPLSFERRPNGLVPGIDQISCFQEELTLPYEPEPIKELSRHIQVYIFNVGPFEFVRDMGSYGAIKIPRPSEGCDISAPLVIPGLPSELYPGLHGMVRIYHQPIKEILNPGLDFARSVVGIDPVDSTGSDFGAYGVFISENSSPHPDSIASARERLFRTATEECDRADGLYRSGKFHGCYNGDSLNKEWLLSLAGVIGRQGDPWPKPYPEAGPL